jgi:hypothetical protein
MPKSQIIKDIVDDVVSLEKSLNRLFVLAEDVNNKQLAQWADKELKGYKPDDDVPEYRHTVCSHLEYSGINGGFQVKNLTLSKGWIETELMEQISSVNARDGIRFIEVLAANERGAARNLTELAGEVDSATNGGISCTSIYQIIPQSFYQQICAEVKSKMIMALLELEKKYGNLDGLGIDISNKHPAQVERINSDLNNAIFNINVPSTEVKLEPWYSKIAWNIMIPIITAIVGGVGVAIVIKCFRL